jgi:hypothetical protein
MVSMSRPAVAHQYAKAVEHQTTQETQQDQRASADAWALTDQITRGVQSAAPLSGLTTGWHAEVTQQAQVVADRVKGIDAQKAGTARRSKAVRDALDATRELNALLTTTRRQDPIAHRTWSATHKPVRALHRQLTSEARRTATRHHLNRAAGPAARLDVASPAYGQVRANGLAELFPANTVHAQRSTAVVAGNDCELQSVTHYHVRSASLDPGRLATDGAARDALREAVADPSDRRIDALQAELNRLCEPTPDSRTTRRSVPVRARHTVSVSRSEAVQIGDGSTMKVDSRIVVEQTRLPIVDLLARDKALTRAYVESLREPSPGPATARFLGRVVDASRTVNDRTVLDHAKGLPRSDTSLLSLFGLAVVDRADAVMIGSGNRLRTRSEVHRPGLSRGTVLKDLAKVGDRARRGLRS